MDISDSWQTPAALAVVGLTIVGLVLRYFRRRKSKKSGACGSGCACPSLAEKTKR